MASNKTDIRFLKGVGEKRAEVLKSKGIVTIGALLRYYPRAYQDWGCHTPIAECPFDRAVCVRAKIISPIKEDFKRPGMVLYNFVVSDGSGEMTVTLFNQKYLANRLHAGSEYLFYGKVGGSFIMRQMSGPDIAETGYAGIRPIYPASSAISSKALEKIIKNALMCDIGDDPIPQSLRDRLNLCDLAYALQNIHFPKTPEALERARKRLVFEELFVLQTALLALKGKNRATAGSVLKNTDISEFEKLLSFTLTGAQKRAIADCMADMSSGRQMNRLVQGDVGSGKTAVAAAVCYAAAKNGFQSALMAPTEILAEQHYKTFCEIMEKTNIRCGLLTASLTKKQKTLIKEKLKNGELDLVIGTHALLVEDVGFKNLGLVITDEQHRFGVTQRGVLAAKGTSPHTLVMSATPIPRTLALIIYGDLDISIIDEYPRGRMKTETYCVDSSYRERIYNFIKKHIKEGRQAYIVCPMIEESESADIAGAAEYYETLRDGPFSGYSTGLLHGKMPAKEKDSVMRRFKEGEIKLLVATTVIEVGIDVPNAVIMVIENAERFGLSQLHQLRGRIGRGQHKSYCILISDIKSGPTAERLKVIQQNIDGFKIADEDLKLRGPGDFLGSRQHGLPDLRIADISADTEVLRLAGREAAELLQSDPGLVAPENAALRQEIIELYERLVEN